MASRTDDTITALGALAAPGPFVTGSLADRQRSYLLAKTGKTSGSMSELMIAAGLPVQDVLLASQVALP